MSKRLVLIEDEPNIIEAITFILAREGWAVTTCANGEAAVAAVRKAEPDAVLLDVMLPGQSGFEILRELRADTAFAGLPVLMLTARGQKKDRDLAASLGVTRFMTKPFANAELVAALNDITS
ncbi:MAG TPA: response regulator transcription factor [Rhodobacterales bacterium]|nr:response regulator transcription factor [Rhodobacterales bacterium]